MFEELYQPLPDPDAYLRRIGVSGPAALDRAYLDRLIAGHQQSIPFENLDAYDRDLPISLGVRDLFDKLVTRRRGGYCFEMNGLFRAALEALGFSVSEVAVRINRPDARWPMLSHRALIVTLAGQRLLCDVGFGGPAARRSLEPDSDAPQRSGDYDYRFIRRDGDIRLCISRDGVEQVWMQFADRPVDPVDFLPLNEYQSRSPQSRFRTQRIVNLCTPGGSAALTDSQLTLRQGGVEQVLTLDTQDALRQALRQYFGIDAPFPLRMAGMTHQSGGM